MDEQAWIERTAAELGRALDDPGARVRVLALLDGHERDRARRLEAARREMAALEITWPLLEEEPHGP